MQNSKSKSSRREMVRYFIAFIFMVFFVNIFFGCHSPSTNQAKDIWTGFDQYLDRSLEDGISKAKAEYGKAWQFLSPLDYSHRREFKKGSDVVQEAINNNRPITLVVGGFGLPYKVDPEFGLPTEWGGCTAESGEREQRAGIEIALRWAASRGFYPVNSSKRSQSSAKAPQ